MAAVVAVLVVYTPARCAFEIDRYFCECGKLRIPCG
jgi:hypothetical protein